jgi:hypothetical protein
MLQMCRNPSEALVAAIEEKVEALVALVVFLEKGFYGLANEQQGDDCQGNFLVDDQTILSSEDLSVHDLQI